MAEIEHPAAMALVSINGSRLELRGDSAQHVVNAALGLGSVTVLKAQPPEVGDLIREGQDITRTMNM